MLGKSVGRPFKTKVLTVGFAMSHLRVLTAHIYSAETTREAILLPSTSTLNANVSGENGRGGGHDVSGRGNSVKDEYVNELTAQSKTTEGTL